MISKLIKAIFLVIAVAGSDNVYAQQNFMAHCHRTGGTAPEVCEVSIMYLISNPDKFDGKWVSITGFLSDGKFLLLFSDKDSWQHSVTSNSIYIELPQDKRLLKKLLDLNLSEITMEGIFHLSPVLTESEAGYRTLGTLTNVRRFGRASGPWGFLQMDSAIIRALKSKPKVGSGSQLPENGPGNKGAAIRDGGN